MSHRSMTRDNTNSRWLILTVYPTIKHTVTKSSYFLGLSLGLSLFAMGDGLLSFSGHETLTGAASSTSLSLGQEDSLLDIFSHTCCGALSLRSLLGTWAVSCMGLLPFQYSPCIYLHHLLLLHRCLVEMIQVG